MCNRGLPKAACRDEMPHTRSRDDTEDLGGESACGISRRLAFSNATIRFFQMEFPSAAEPFTTSLFHSLGVRAFILRAAVDLSLSSQFI